MKKRKKKVVCFSTKSEAKRAIIDNKVQPPP